MPSSHALCIYYFIMFATFTLLLHPPGTGITICTLTALLVTFCELSDVQRSSLQLILQLTPSSTCWHPPLVSIFERYKWLTLAVLHLSCLAMLAVRVTAQYHTVPQILVGGFIGIILAYFWLQLCTYYLNPILVKTLGFSSMWDAYKVYLADMRSWSLLSSPCPSTLYYWLRVSTMQGRCFKNTYERQNLSLDSTFDIRTSMRLISRECYVLSSSLDPSSNLSDIKWPAIPEPRRNRPNTNLLLCMIGMVVSVFPTPEPTTNVEKREIIEGRLKKIVWNNV